MAEPATVLTDPAPAAAPEGPAPAAAPEGPPAAQNSPEGGTPPQGNPDPAGTQGDSGDNKTGDAPEGEGGEQPSGPPEKYEFEFPDGVEPSESLLEAVTPIFKDLGLTQEQAQKLTSAYAETSKAQIEAHQAEVANWAKESEADPEIGGAKFRENVGVAQAALRQFGDDSLTELLNTSGLGNHPTVLRFFHKVGKALGEDGHVRAGTPGDQRKTPIELFYPNHSKE